MGMVRKTIVQVFSTTSTTGGTFALSNQGGLLNAENFMDVILNIKTLDTGGVQLSVQEQFSDLFVETLSTGNIAATGVSVYPHEINGTQAAFTSHAMLGKGHAKNFVLTTTGNPTAVAADCYAVFYNMN